MAIRQALETDHESASLLLDAYEVFPQDGCMMVCRDSQGTKYEVPLYVINDPVSEE